MLTTTATWCIVLAALIVGAWALIAERTKRYDEQRVEPVCTDHWFVEHPEDPDACNHWYVGSPAVGWAEVCPYSRAQHEREEYDTDDLKYMLDEAEEWGELDDRY